MSTDAPASGRPTHTTAGASPAPATVLVHGAGLAALAAAARLGKAGHHVVLDTDGLPDGGHWAVRSQLGVEVDELPQTFALPAAWRDLFKKSGRALDAELAGHRMALVPAPDQVHRFADGRELRLPSERGAQLHAITEAFGRPAATAWTTLLDELDELWQQLRMVGLERPVTKGSLTRHTRAALLAGTTLEELAERAGDPRLGAIVRSQAGLAGAPPGRAPALRATRLAVHRRFGSWQLVDEQGHPLRASRMLELLSQRLDLRGVERIGRPQPLLGTGAPDLSVIDSPSAVSADAELEARPQLPLGFAGRQLAGPAQAPTISQRVIDDDELVASPADGIVELLDHTSGAPVVSWHRGLPDGGVLVTEHDHTRPRPDLEWGLAPSSWSHWRSRPLLGGDGHWQASAASHAGNEPWAELLSAALAVYEIHQHLTGDDIRPTNREQPRLPRQARPPVRR